jgi:hypothetical protein
MTDDERLAREEEKAQKKRNALLRPVPAFINDSHYGNWVKYNCALCKWGANGLIMLYPCPVQATIYSAAKGNGMIRPWVMHVAGISDGGECLAKEIK